MAVAYTTAQLDAIVAGLQTKLTVPVETRHGDKSIRNQSEAEILASITYFQALYATATDAPVTPSLKVRTYFGYGNKGMGI
jgi:hypothetical protein